MRLLEQVERALVVRRRSPKTIEAYMQWTRRYIRFHGRRHPNELGAAEVRAFLVRVPRHRDHQDRGIVIGRIGSS